MRSLQSFLKLISIFFLPLLAGCAGNYSTKIKVEQHASVDVYFFHTNYRCETCEAIKSETRKSLAELFGEDVWFGIYNLEDEGKEMAARLGVKSLMLVAVKDGTKINLTNEAYLYARIDPVKYRQALEEKIKPLLK